MCCIYGPCGDSGGTRRWRLEVVGLGDEVVLIVQVLQYLGINQGSTFLAMITILTSSNNTLCI